MSWNLQSLYARLAAFFVVITAAIACEAQVGVNNSTTTPIPGAGHDYIHFLSETVDPANGSVSVRINVPDVKGRQFSLPFSFSYDSNGVQALAPYFTGAPGGGNGSIWTNSSFSGSFLTKGGWSYSMPLLSNLFMQKKVVAAGSPQPPCDIITDFEFQDPAGTRHLLPLFRDACLGEVGSANDAGDGRLIAHWPSAGGITIAEANGTVYHFGSNPSHNVTTPATTPVTTASSVYQSMADWVEDVNGNRITIQDLSGPTTSGQGKFQATDTLGRTAIAASEFGQSGDTVSISGLGSSYVLTWGTATGNFTVGSTMVSPPWPCHSGVAAYHQTYPVVTAITLPNKQQYHFEYDSTYGLLSKITYPNGGYVKYTWGLNPLAAFIETPDSGPVNTNPNACWYRYDKPAIIQRDVSFDGNTISLTQQFSYSTTWSTDAIENWSSKQTIVTNTDKVRNDASFQTVYTYQPFGAPTPPRIPPPPDHLIPVEQTVLHQDANGSTLLTVNKTWYNLFELQTEIHTLDNGASSQVAYAYGPGAQVKEKDEYDYGQTSSPCIPGNNSCPTPIRKTISNYQGFANTPIYPSTPSIFSRPCQTLVYGNGNVAAETDYLYDGGTSVCGTAGTPSVTSVSGLPSGTHDETNYGAASTAPRGDATSKIVKCFTGAGTASQTACPQGDSTTSYAYDETGQITATTDPRGNTTKYFYADNFSDHGPIGSNAYLTEIDYPATPVPLNGTTAAHNDTFSYDYSDGQLASATDQNGNVTNYSYDDPLRRLTSTVLADHGETDIAYNDASNQMTTTTKINATTSLTTLSQMDGVGHLIQTQITSDPQGTIYVDTGYDGMGRAYTVSNPYRNSNDPTGTKTTYYDTLGRVTETLDQDGSVTTTSYSGNQVTSVDEAGNPRRRISDVLGRVIEVDEATATDPITPATAPSGSLSVNGSLLVKNVPASATITINGTEQCGTFYAGAQGVPTQICDIGTVSATINGTTATQPYCCQANAASLASGLANVIMTATNATVSAIANNNVITLTATNGGPCCNYSLSATSTSNYLTGSGAPVTFPAPSFSATPSGPALTGGTTVYDSGTAVLTIGSTTVSVPYGASGSASSVASAFAQALSGSPYSGNANGSTLTITSNAAGPASSVSATLTSNSTLFGNGAGSFSGSATISGGSNSHVTLTETYETHYFYDALGNLTCASQHGNATSTVGCTSPPGNDGSSPWRIRRFTYDSMSHLVRAQNPESGTTAYTYDPNGNVTTKTDANGLTINYSPSDSPIDALNRVTKKTYSNGAQPVSYIWDATSLFGAPMHNQVGRLTYQSAGNGGTERFDYDVMGRLIQVYEYERLDDNSPSVNVTYDLTGNMSWIQYPDGRQLNYSYNAGNRLTNVAFTGWNGSAPSGGVYNYWTANSYFPNGMPQQVTYGNGVTETMALNNRLQPAEQKVSNLQTFVDHVYSYCHGDGDCLENNGNVMSVADKLNPTLTQTFTYDWLNRVIGATEGRWGQSFQYDPWGNLTGKTTTKGSMNSVGLQIGNSNRVTTISYNNLAGIPFTYDANGNLNADDMRGYTYDEENRIIALGISPGVLTGAASYSYDPDGSRVTKVAGGTTTEYVYFKGQPVAELNPANGKWIDYVFAGDKRVAKADSFEDRLHIWGTSCSNCGSQWYQFAFANKASGYVIQAGDKIVWRQWSVSGSPAGIIIHFTDGSDTSTLRDQDGQPMGADGYQDQWHNRVIDLTPAAGKTVNSVSLNVSGTSGSNLGTLWNVYYQDIVGLIQGGIVSSLYSHGTSAPSLGGSGSPGMSATSYTIDTNSNAGPQPQVSTTYYHGDQIGSSRLLTGSAGWPVWQGTFLPFGEEYNPQPTTNHYKFSGKERDAESNNDYFGARYYDNNIGRWMTPDWAARPTAVPYAIFGDPQTLNLYSFNANNPLNKVDADGHTACQFVNHDQCTDTSSGSVQIFVNDDGSVTISRSSTATWSDKDKNGKVVDSGTTTITSSVTIAADGHVASTQVTEFSRGQDSRDNVRKTFSADSKAVNDMVYRDIGAGNLEIGRETVAQTSKVVRENFKTDEGRNIMGRNGLLNQLRDAITRRVMRCVSGEGPCGITPGGAGGGKKGEGEGGAGGGAGEGAGEGAGGAEIPPL
jgi:RHS repeat-associated protein